MTIQQKNKTAYILYDLICKKHQILHYRYLTFFTTTILSRFVCNEKPSRRKRDLFYSCHVDHDVIGQWLIQRSLLTLPVLCLIDWVRFRHLDKVAMADMRRSINDFWRKHRNPLAKYWLVYITMIIFEKYMILKIFSTDIYIQDLTISKIEWIYCNYPEDALWYLLKRENKFKNYLNLIHDWVKCCTFIFFHIIIHIIWT